MLESHVDCEIKSVSYEFGHECFEGFWDLLIETTEEKILVEYKSGGDESNIEEVIRQIHQRQQINSEKAKDLDWYIEGNYKVWMLSFDPYFENFRSVFDNSDIQLVVPSAEEHSLEDKLNSLEMDWTNELSKEEKQ